MKFLGFALALLAVGGAWWLARTSSTAPAVSIDRPDEPPIQLVAPDDPDILEATEQARATIDRFLAELAREGSPPARAQVKARIEEGNVVEHVWLVDLRYEAGMVYGVVGNEPLQLQNWRRGDRAMVDPREITDWLLIDEYGVHGGFTVHASRERLSPDQRERFDSEFLASFGVPLGDGDADGP